MDFSNYSLEQLKTMLADLPAEIKRRAAEERAKVLADLERFAGERGFKLAELVGSPKVEATKVKKEVPAKYRNPANPGETWTGRGRAPKWLAGHPKESWGTFEIK